MDEILKELELLKEKFRLQGEEFEKGSNEAYDKRDKINGEQLFDLSLIQYGQANGVDSCIRIIKKYIEEKGE